MTSGILFLVTVLHLAINGSSGSPVLVTRSIANRKVWEAILYGYVVDPDSPSFLGKGDEIFNVPDDIKDDVVSIMRDDVMKMQIDYSDSDQSAAESLAVNMNVKGSYGAFSAAASMQVSKSSSKSIKTVRLDAVTMAKKYKVKAINELLNQPEKFLTESFKNTVRTESFEHIEHNIGIFYATSLDLGGELRKSYVMQATKEDNEQSVRAELEGKYGRGAFSVSASVSTQYDTRESNKDAKVKIEWHARGGDTTVWFGASLGKDQNAVDKIKNEWKDTIKDNNLYPFEFRLAYLWDLIKKVDHDRGIAYKAYLEAKWAKSGTFHPSRFLQSRDRYVKSSRTIKYMGHFGEWASDFEQCNEGYVVSFSQKVEQNQGRRDDTALNGICLYCSDGKKICSKVGRYGTWAKSGTCSAGFNKANFKLERHLGNGKDDTAANELVLYCSSGGAYRTSNAGEWGDWQGLMSCASGQKICGLKTRVEAEAKDKSGLNGVELMCCNKISG